MPMFNMQQGMGQPGQPMPAPFNQGQGPGLFSFSTPQAIQQPQQAPQPQQSSHIKPSVWGILADALSGAAGQPGKYAADLSEQMKAQRETAAKTAQAQQQSALEYSRQQQMYDYKLSHPEPAVAPMDRDTEAFMKMDPTHRAAYMEMERARNPFGGAFEVNGQRVAPSGGGGGGPVAGAVEDGHRFKGGDASNPANWEPVTAGGPASQAPGGFPASE